MSSTSNLYSGFGAKSKGGAPVYHVDEAVRHRRSQTPTKRPTFTLSGKGAPSGGNIKPTGRTVAALYGHSRSVGDAVSSGAMDRYHAPTPPEKAPKPLR